MMTLGSLFDGIGGFPLAAVHCGGVPVWASEIEPFPMRVTKLRFPDMIHVGDITKLDGAKLPPVDVICGGSPCQDLSVAGLRKGLAGERSGLFMDQVRIVKEMRAEDERRGVSDDLFDLDTSFGKMSLEHSVPQMEKISGRSSRRLSISRTVPVMCLDLTPGAGNLLGLHFGRSIQPGLESLGCSILGSRPAPP